jgi:hypothetical protein
LTKSELIEALRTNGDEAVGALRAVPAAEFELGRYENGWNGRQILAHVASIEWTYRRLIDVAKQAPTNDASARGPAPTPAPTAEASARRTSVEESKGIPTRAPEGGILSYNDRQVEKRAGVAVSELIAEFETNRAGTIAAVEACDEALLQTPIRSTGGITGPLAGVIQSVALGHVSMHIADIAGKEWKGPRF